jgi:hypothetical protein
MKSQMTMRLETRLAVTCLMAAANSDGSIPAWTGVYDKVPDGYVSGNPRPAPFPQDELVYSIDAKNLEQHSAELTEGVIALFKKHPDYRIDVYPTRRTAGAPQWVRNPVHNWGSKEWR